MRFLNRASSAAAGCIVCSRLPVLSTPRSAGLAARRAPARSPSPANGPSQLRDVMAVCLCPRGAPGSGARHLNVAAVLSFLTGRGRDPLISLRCPLWQTSVLADARCGNAGCSGGRRRVLVQDGGGLLGWRHPLLPGAPCPVISSSRQRI